MLAEIPGEGFQRQTGTVLSKSIFSLSFCSGWTIEWKKENYTWYLCLLVYFYLAYPWLSVSSFQGCQSMLKIDYVIPRRAGPTQKSLRGPEHVTLTHWERWPSTNSLEISKVLVCNVLTGFHEIKWREQECRSTLNRHNGSWISEQPALTRSVSKQSN